MPMNFPDSPALNAIYSSGGMSWVWTGTAWKAYSVPGAGATISDTPPATTVNGNLWWNSSPGDGQLYCWFNDGSSSQWVVANNLGAGIYLPLTGGQLSGALTINQNTVAPPAGLSPSFYVVGADTRWPTIVLDVFGANCTGQIVARAARGTAAAPTAIQDNDYLMQIGIIGRGATSYGSSLAASINIRAMYNWTDTAQGTKIEFYTTPQNSVSPANVLILRSDTSTFGSNVCIGTSYLYLNNSGGSVNASGGPFIYGDSGSLVMKMPSGNNFQVQNYAGTAGMLAVDGSGVITMAFGYKCKAGTAGTYSNVFNIHWTGSAANLWIDNVNQGAIQVVASDERLKSNIKPATVDTLATINAIELSEFDFRVTDLSLERHYRAGVIAQQLADVIPEAVTEDNSETLNVQLLPIVSHLIGAVQQLSRELEALKCR